MKRLNIATAGLLLVISVLVGAIIVAFIAGPLPQARTEGGVKRFGPAWLTRRNGIYLLHLEGTDYEMGYQHGVLMRDEIRRGEALYIGKFFRAQIEHSFIGESRVVVSLAEKFLQLLFFEPVIRRLPPASVQAFKGLADGAGIERDILPRAVVMADAAQTIAGTLYGGQKVYPALDRFKDFGCTSFIAAGGATQDGHVLHGRNFDFPGAGHFDPYPVIAYCRPASGQRYVMFTSAGFHTAGVTALNESGLAVGFHTSITSDVDPDGWPVMGLGDEIIRRASTIEDAVAILRRHPPAAGWIMVVSSASQHKGVAVEISRHHLVIVPMKNDTLAVANSYRAPEMMAIQTSMNWAETINSYARTRRMNLLLQENYDRIDAQKGAQFLGDHFDINTRCERATGDVIGQMSNVSSVVIDSTSMDFWLAMGPAPVCNSSYAGFNFEDGFAGPDRFRELPRLHGIWENDPRLAAYRLYIDAEVNYENSRPGRAVEDLKKALAIDPAEPVYAQALGLVYLRIGRSAEAQDMFARALSIPQTFHRQSLGHLWLGRSRDLQGRRAQARDEYRQVLAITPLNPQVKEAAENGLHAPYSPSQARRISVDFGSGDSYSY